jgi:hypothetical protein
MHDDIKYDSWFDEMRARSVDINKVAEEANQEFNEGKARTSLETETEDLLLKLTKSAGAMEMSLSVREGFVLGVMFQNLNSAVDQYLTMVADQEALIDAHRSELVSRTKHYQEMLKKFSD